MSDQVPSIDPIAPLRVALKGRYEIQREIGQGAFATVYLARDSRHERFVALKVLNADPTSEAGEIRFIREIRLLAGLQHPNILPLHDSGHVEALLYYVMPYVSGETLRARMNRERWLSIEAAVCFARESADALACAHGQGIIHRDIKPENILLSGGHAIVADFGIARAIDIAGVRQLTRTGMGGPGTPAYMSPEQLLGDNPLDGRSDIYSLGCVLYEMLSGKPPFAGKEGFVRRFTESAPLPSSIRKEVEPWLDAVVETALSRNPGDRYATAGELVRALSGHSTAEPAARSDRATPRATPASGERISHSPPVAAALVVREVEQASIGVLPFTNMSTRQSIAVLPFTNMSADPENEYFSDGIAEEIINSLTKVQALDVVSRTSAFAFRSTNEDIREIGRKLEVRTILEGSVRKAANRLRVNAQLIDIHSGYHLWSERYDREIADVFAIQDEIADNIVKALRVVLTAREHVALKKAATRDVRAYEYYLRGRQLYHQQRREAHQRARELYRRAIDIDPNYALAYAGIADSASFQYMYFGGEQRDLEEADSASRRALELDPTAAEAHASRGLALTLTRRYQEAESELAESMRLDPTLFEAPYFYGRTALAQGNYAAAVEMYERAAALRRDDYQPVILSVMPLEKLGRLEEAEKANLRGLALIERAVAIDPGDQRALYLGVGVLFRLGDTERAEEWTARVLALGPEEPGTLYNLACHQAVMGHTDKALELLVHAIACGFSHLDWVLNDPDLVSLHGDPKYEQIVASLKKT